MQRTSWILASAFVLATSVAHAGATLPSDPAPSVGDPGQTSVAAANEAAQGQEADPDAAPGKSVVFNAGAVASPGQSDQDIANAQVGTTQAAAARIIEGAKAGAKAGGVAGTLTNQPTYVPRGYGEPRP